MRVYLPWLEEFVAMPPQQEVAQHFAQAGIEVEAEQDLAAAFQGVVVARIQAVLPHPEANKLHVCRVFDGQRTHQVICGAPHLQVGWVVAWAPPGSRVGTQVLGIKNLRGTDSAGMLCARRELGLPDDGQDSAGLWLLDAGTPLGQDVQQALKFGRVLTLGITPNRSDLLGHLGLARELGAATKKRVQATKGRLLEKGPEVSTLARALVDEPLACKRFVGRVVQNLQVGPSPLWLRERLAAVGQRSVNNVVDATNYVMFELNQPLHAYDLDQVQAAGGVKTLHVRAAQPGERLTTLDGVERTLAAEDLLVADAAGPVALAGVMGGQRAQVTAATSQILLEGACFEPLRVRQGAKRHALRSEASLRFERGTDAGAVLRAVDRCAQLLQEVAQGQVAKGALDVQQKSDGALELTLRLAQIERLLGVRLGAEQVVGLLEPLEIRCVRRTESALVLQIPTFRGDIAREVDLIEEVARRYGYDQLAETLPNPASAHSFAPILERPQDAARQALLAAGLNECVHFAFAAPTEGAMWTAPEVTAVPLQNPLGEQQSLLRTSLLPALLQTVAHNLRHGQKQAAVFEVGHVFRAGTTAQKLPPQAHKAGAEVCLPTQTLMVAAALWGPRAAGRWYEQGENYALPELKGVLEDLLEAYDVDANIVYLPAKLAGFNPHAAAEIVAEGTGSQLSLGHFGQVKATVAKAHVPADGRAPLGVLELSLDALARLPRRPLMAQPLPKFPSTQRDVAFVAPSHLPAETLRAAVARHAGGTLGPQVVAEVRLFDVYAGDHVAADARSLAFAITYQHPTRTLNDAEVNVAFHAALSAVCAELPVTVRDGQAAAAEGRA